MDIRESQALMAEIAPVIHDYVQLAVTPLAAALGRLEARLNALPEPERGEAGTPGVDGRSVMLEDVIPEIERAVAVEVAKIRVPSDGRDGQDADPGLVASMVAAGVENAVRALPVPDRGPVGEPGPAGSVDMDVIAEMVSTAVVRHVPLLPPGERGEPGPAGEVDMEALERLVDGAVVRAVAALPAPERGPAGEQGPPGTPGRDGVDGMDGENGERGEPGRDGIGIASAIIGRDGNLQLSFTDGHLLDVGGVVGRDGASGRDGVDGMAGAAGERGTDGLPGAAGVGVVEAVVRDGLLVLSLTDGRSIDVGYISGETGPTGAPGRDGADIDEAAFHVKLSEAVTKAVAELPPAERGPDGPAGQPGRDGIDGAGVDLEQVARMVDADVTAAVFALPPPERGEPGPQGERGAPGERGQSGIGLASALIDRNGGLVVTLTDGSTKELGRVVGADADMDTLAKTIVDEIGKIPRPRDGRDGTDGVGFDGVEVVQTDERHAVVRFIKGERVREFPIVLPGMLDRGVWKDGEKYLRGDVTTWGGSTFICQVDAPVGKPEVSAEWRLAVKRGRDGKDGRDGRPGERGADGRPGRDGGTY